MEKLSHEMEWKEKDQQRNANLYITEGAERKKVVYEEVKGFKSF